MSAAPIYLSSYDHRRVRELLPTVDDRARRRDLHAELARAIIVPPHARVPGHVVTVGSRVTVQDQLTGELADVLLTLPGDLASAASTEASVISPLGTALLGCTEGEVVTFRADRRVRELKILRVVQSSVAEAAAALAII